MSERAREPWVLLVHDDDGIRRAYSRALQKLGYRVATAVDGREAGRFNEGGRQFELR